MAAMIYLVAAYGLIGLCITLGRLWLLQRMGVVLPMTGLQWFFCVLIWPLDLFASAWRLYRARRKGMRIKFWW